MAIDSIQIVLGQLNDIENYCRDAGFDLSVAQVARIRTEAGRKLTFSEIRKLVEELQQRIEDEMLASILMQVSRDKAGYYRTPFPFGEEVNCAFPSASFDAEEAAKCLATGRNTACVFHLMRVMESAVRALAGALALPDAGSRNWGQILNQIRSEIAKRNMTCPSDWDQNRSFFEGAVAHLDAVRVAWRNPAMHLDQSYDGEKAEDIFSAVKGFMRHASMRLKE
jgi:hypothetical protein